MAARRSIVVIKRNEVPGSLLGKTLKSVMKLRTYLSWTDPQPLPEGAGQEAVKQWEAAWGRALDTFEKRLRLSLDCLQEEEEEEQED